MAYTSRGGEVGLGLGESSKPFFRAVSKLFLQEASGKKWEKMENISFVGYLSNEKMKLFRPAR